MREIKFRAWDNKQKEIHTWESLKCNSISVAYLFSNTDLSLLQYTGLKDKNGIEIYEGDIVKDSSNRFMSMEWDDRIGTSRFILKAINSVHHIKAGRILNTHDWILQDDNDIEVIGNIYENPELLKDINQ